jgi:hypothetical protein
MSHTIYSVVGDSKPTITIVLKDKGDADADPSDPDTWPVIDLSADAVRIDYYTERAYGEVTASATADTLTWVNHPFSDGDRVRLFTDSVLPGGLVNTTLYWVVNSTDDTFQVSATEGGSAIDITDAGTGDHFAAKQIETQTTTFTTDGTDGSVYFNHPANVYNSPGDYIMEIILVYADASTETAYDTLRAHVRTK